jgi:hypothetical protein
VRLERRSCEEETKRGERLGFEISSYDYTIHRWCCHQQQCICKLVSLRAPRNQSFCWGSPIYRSRYTSVEQHGEYSVLLFLRMSTWRSSFPSFDFGDGYRLRSTRVRSLSLQPPQRWLVSYGMTMARDMMSFGIWRRMGLETWQIAGDGGNAGKMLQRLLLGRARMPSALTPSQLSALVLYSNHFLHFTFSESWPTRNRRGTTTLHLSSSLLFLISVRWWGAGWRYDDIVT